MNLTCLVNLTEIYQLRLTFMCGSLKILNV